MGRSARPMTQEQRAIATEMLEAQHAPLSRVMERLGVSRDWLISQMGIKTNPVKEIPLAVQDEMVRMNEQGLTAHAIAKVTGYGVARVYRIVGARERGPSVESGFGVDGYAYLRAKIEMLKKGS